uniref:FH2 domain-containing protein 1 n=1 Tax=Phallusia mammillata TaxID=59560 RepID=A0A6F9DCB0_9ASCI|nr:FH2 domain-containing protein 1 [Phallusia mammillata]
MDALNIDCSDISDESDDVETASQVWHRLFAEELELKPLPNAEVSPVQIVNKPKRNSRRRKPAYDIFPFSSESELSQTDTSADRAKSAKPKRVTRHKPQKRRKNPPVQLSAADDNAEIEIENDSPPEFKPRTSRKAKVTKHATPKAFRRSARLRGTGIVFADSSQSLESDTMPEKIKPSTNELKDGESTGSETLLDTPPFASDDSLLLTPTVSSPPVENPAGIEAKSCVEPTTELDDLFFSASKTPIKKAPPRKSKRLLKTKEEADCAENHSQASGESTLLTDDSLWGH